MTLAESMALAVLKGDTDTAYALAIALLEERDHGFEELMKGARTLRETRHGIAEGYGVYRWPEFQAFCKRVGVFWDLRTISMVITIAEGAMLTIEQKYQGTDNHSETAT